VREYRRGNNKWTIQRNWQHKTKKNNMCLTPLLLISSNSSYIYLYRITVDTYISKVGLHFASLPFLSRQFYIKAFSSADVYYLIISITRSSKSGVKHILFFFVLCCQFLWIVINNSVQIERNND
jgi:hypothetical protein